MLADILGAQALLLLILGAGVAVGAANQRWPGPGRVLVLGLDRLFAGWTVGQLGGVILAVLTAFALGAFAVAR